MQNCDNKGGKCIKVSKKGYNNKSEHFAYGSVPTRAIKQFKYNNCHVMFDNRRYYKNHKKFVHNSTTTSTVKCCYCHKLFKDEIALEIHVRKFHNSSESVQKVVHDKTKSVKYNDSNKMFNRKKRIDNSTESVICYNCDKVYKHKGALIKHLEKSHDASKSVKKLVRDRTKSVKCSECNQMFYDLKYYRRRKKLILVKTVKCNKCHKFNNPKHKHHEKTVYNNTKSVKTLILRKVKHKTTLKQHVQEFYNMDLNK